MLPSMYLAVVFLLAMPTGSSSTTSTDSTTPAGPSALRCPEGRNLKKDDPVPTSTEECSSTQPTCMKALTDDHLDYGCDVNLCDKAKVSDGKCEDVTTFAKEMVEKGNSKPGATKQKVPDSAILCCSKTADFPEYTKVAVGTPENIVLLVIAVCSTPYISL